MSKLICGQFDHRHYRRNNNTFYYLVSLIVVDSDKNFNKSFGHRDVVVKKRWVNYKTQWASCHVLEKR